jgi:hypothetical protein
LRLLLDEHYSPTIAQGLRGRGHDVVAVAERADLVGAADCDLLESAGNEGRVLVTNNARHLVPIATELLGTGGSHAGLVLTSDRSLSRATGPSAISSAPSRRSSSPTPQTRRFATSFVDELIRGT